MKWIWTPAVVAGALLVAGCGATSPPAHPGRTEPAKSEKPYDFKQEGKIPPPAPGESRVEPDVEEMAVKRDTIPVSDAPAPIDTTRRLAPPDSTVDGFRIQVFASSDREVAESARRAASERLGLPSYLDLEGGVYKVRVGNYSARAEAEASLPTVRSRYYADAWIVPARVTVARPPGP